jgi:hypothetical protein
VRLFMIACKTQKKSRSVAVFATALLGTVHKTSCLLYPRKRTCAVQLTMPAMGQKRTFGGAEDAAIV